MTVSSSFDSAVDGDDVIAKALIEVNAVAAGQTPNGNIIEWGRFKLNALLKNIMGPNNIIMPGLKTWLRKTTTLTLTATASYQLKPSTIAFTSGGTYEILPGDTITGATGSATATVIAVSVSTGTWAGGDAAGTITLISQSGTFQSENLKVGANSNMATISGDSSQTGGGKDIVIPLEILSIIRRNSSNIDYPMDKMASFSTYDSIRNKSAVGTPLEYFYEKKIDAGYLYLDKIPSDITDTLIIRYLSEIDDIDVNTDTVYVTKEYLRPLIWMLADEMTVTYPVSARIQKKIEDKLRESLGFAQTFEPEETDAYFQPGLD